MTLKTMTDVNEHENPNSGGSTTKKCNCGIPRLHLSSQSLKKINKGFAQ
jgi:hypothetical protein